jgi:hypothetical protein
MFTIFEYKIWGENNYKNAQVKYFLFPQDVLTVVDYLIKTKFN